jgi:hypothetical protein
VHLLSPAAQLGIIYLNALMSKELEAMVYLCRALAWMKLPSITRMTQELLAVIHEHC